MPHQAQDPQAGGPQQFATTRWSIVLAAGDRGLQNPQATTALAELYEAYWMPLYAFARRRGCSAADAADVTQAFFAALLEKDYLQAADPSRGRFRAFLLTAFQRFLAKERRDARTLKRGGGVHIRSLDVSTADSRYALDPATTETPERTFDRHWALTLLDRVLQRVEQEYRERGRLEFFQACRGALTTTAPQTGYDTIATQFNMSPAAVRVAVHRLRSRYRELLRSEVAQTVASSDDIDAELQALLEAVQA